MAAEFDILAHWLDAIATGSSRRSVSSVQGNGVTTSFNFNFTGGYVAQSDVKAYIYDDVAKTSTDIASPVFTGPNTIQVTPALPNTKWLVMYRSTYIDKPLVDFSSGAPMTEDNLDHNAEQAVFSAAEVVDRFDSVSDQSALALANSQTAVSQAGTALSQSTAAVNTANTASSNATAAVNTANTANGKADQALSYTLTGVPSNGNNVFTGSNTFSQPVAVATAVSGGQATTKAQVDAADTLRVLKGGDTMTGNLTIPNGTAAGHAVTKAQLDASVISFNTRTGAVTLSSGDVTTALGFTPYNATNPASYITSGGAPVQSVFGRTGTVAMNSTDVTTALAFTPVNKAGDTLSGDLTPNTTNTRNLGSASLLFANLWATNLNGTLTGNIAGNTTMSFTSGASASAAFAVSNPQSSTTASVSVTGTTFAAAGLQGGECFYGTSTVGANVVLGIAAGGSGIIRFLTAATEAGRFLSTGQMGLGATGIWTSNGARFNVHYAGAATEYGASMNTAATTGRPINFLQGGAAAGGAATVVGNITITTTATAYNTSSDHRMKEAIVDAPECGAVIDALRVRSFRFKRDGTPVTHGFIAQELYAVAPDAVAPGDDDPVNITTTWGVDAGKLVPMLVKELQSLRRRVAQLEAS
jgi:hypothetical protein